MKNKSIRQRLKPCVMDVDHLAESQSDYEGKEVAGAERFFQHHQCDDQQGLKNIVPGTETEKRKRRAEDERYRGNRRNTKSALGHQIHPEGIDDQNDQKCSFSRKSNFFRIHKLRTLLPCFTSFTILSISEQGLL